MPDEISPQEFGRLQAEVEALRRDMDRQGLMLQTITNQLQSIESRLSEANGGWKVLMAIGGASAALGATVAPIAGRVLRLITT